MAGAIRRLCISCASRYPDAEVTCLAVVFGSCENCGARIGANAKDHRVLRLTARTAIVDINIQAPTEEQRDKRLLPDATITIR